MAKQLTFEYEGEKFTLEYTRRTVKMMEQQGFVLNNVDDIPLTAIPALFAGAFMAHHRFTNRKRIDEIYEKMPNKVDLMKNLAEMYTEPIAALFDEPDEAAEGNVEWGVNW